MCSLSLSLTLSTGGDVDCLLRDKSLLLALCEGLTLTLGVDVARPTLSKIELSEAMVSIQESWSRHQNYVTGTSTTRAITLVIKVSLKSNTGSDKNQPR